jgi:hypothetical protein
MLIPFFIYNFIYDNSALLLRPSSNPPMQTGRSLDTYLDVEDLKKDIAKEKSAIKQLQEELANLRKELEEEQSSGIPAAPGNQLNIWNNNLELASVNEIKRDQSGSESSHLQPRSRSESQDAKDAEDYFNNLEQEATRSTSSNAPSTLVEKMQNLETEIVDKESKAVVDTNDASAIEKTEKKKRLEQRLKQLDLKYASVANKT